MINAALVLGITANLGLSFILYGAAKAARKVKEFNKQMGGIFK